MLRRIPGSQPATRGCPPRWSGTCGCCACRRCRCARCKRRRTCPRRPPGMRPGRDRLGHRHGPCLRRSKELLRSAGRGPIGICATGQLFLEDSGRGWATESNLSPSQALSSARELFGTCSPSRLRRICPWACAGKGRLRTAFLRRFPRLPASSTARCAESSKPVCHRLITGGCRSEGTSVVLAGKWQVSLMSADRRL